MDNDDDDDDDWPASTQMRNVTQVESGTGHKIRLFLGPGLFPAVFSKDDGRDGSIASMFTKVSSLCP